MKGVHHIHIETPKVVYDFDIMHKFSIILGDSGSGKSYMCRSIEAASLNQHGIVVRSDLKIRHIWHAPEIEVWLKRGYNLFILDERAVNEICEGDSGEYFGRLTKGTSAYFIFMSRTKKLTSVPVDVNACYELQSRKIGKKTYMYTDNLYGWRNDSPLSPDDIVIEDSKVGFKFYDETLPNRCISAHGNSNILYSIEKVLENGSKSVFVIADGCGFGVYFYELLMLKKNAVNEYGAEVRLFIPPSFEYIILCSNIFTVNPDILNNTQNYAKIEKYMGWEAFYTDYLVHVSKGAYRKNGKKLPKFLKDSRNTRKIYDFIHEIEGV